jgi:hypothetical protein
MPLMRAAALLLLTLAFPACGAPPTAAPQYVRAWRTVGTWEGSGNALMGNINSETGQFRITWNSHPEAAAGPGVFKLLVRSAVSGRTLDVITDGPGDSRGTADFADAPRVYDFQVDARGATWTVTVEEAYAAPAATP